MLEKMVNKYIFMFIQQVHEALRNASIEACLIIE